MIFINQVLYVVCTIGTLTVGSYQCVILCTCREEDISWPARPHDKGGQRRTG